jgi:hypothetical protein
VVFLHAEAADGEAERCASVLHQSLKHIKWLANKRELKNIVLHSFTHLGGATASPELAESLIATLQQRLSETGYQVWTTPFGYFCEWDLSVYGEESRQGLERDSLTASTPLAPAKSPSKFFPACYNHAEEQILGGYPCHFQSGI